MNSATFTSQLATRDLTPRIGAEIIIDYDDLLRGTYAAQIRSLLQRRGVLIVRNLGLTMSEQCAVAATLGRIRKQDGKSLLPITRDRRIGGVAAEYQRGTVYWHIDGASDEAPNFAATLTPHTLSAAGGETDFANTYAAWEDLPGSEKKALQDLRVVHSMEASQRYVNPTPTVAELSAWQARKPRVHPLVWTHESGRKSLVLGCTADRVEGMAIEEGRMLLCRLMEHVTQPQYVYRHVWEIGDLLIWDNTGTMHRVTPYNPDSGRLLHRITLDAEEALV